MQLSFEQKQRIRNARNLHRRRELGLAEGGERKKARLPELAVEAARERVAVPRTAEENALLALSVAADLVKPMDLQEAKKGCRVS